jgi:hypothetical protein
MYRYGCRCSPLKCRVQEVMSCLQDELIEVSADNKTYRILRFMVQAKMFDLDKGNQSRSSFLAALCCLTSRVTARGGR